MRPVRVHFRAAAAPLLRRALPVAAGFGVIGFVFFGPMGVTARDVLDVAVMGPIARGALWLVWLLPTMPLAFVALDPPGTMWLRSLPVPRWQLAAGAALLLAVVELPLAAFVLRGGGPAEAARWFCLTLLLHAQAFAGVRSVVDGAALAGGVGLVYAPAHFWPAGAALALWCLGRAWMVAPERGSARGRARLAGPPSVALARAHLTGVVRTDGASLGRAALVLVLAGAMCGLVGRNNQVEAWAPLSLAFAGPALAFALSGAVVAALRLETLATPLLDACGIRPGTRVVAGALASAALGLAGGLLFAAGLALVAGVAAPLAPLGGALIGPLLAGSHRSALADAPRATYRIAIGVLLAGAATSVAAALAGALALPLWALAAAGALWATAPLAARRHDPEDAWGVEGR